MSGRRLPVLAIVVAAAVVVALLVGAVAAAEESDDELTLEELREGGTQYSNSPDSVRIAGERMYWVVHWPADAWMANAGDPDDDNWQYLSPGERVDRNAVYLRTINLEETEELTVNVAYYNVDRQRVERDNETVWEETATNVSVAEHAVTLERGWSMAEIPLRQNDENKQVTMWVDGKNADSLRWRFEHKSIATTQAAGINSEGDYLLRAGTEFVFPTLIGAFLVGGLSRRAIKRAAIGPQWGYFRWIVVLSLLMGAVAVFLYRSASSLLVHAPWFVAVFVVAVFGIVLLETLQYGVRKVEFIKPQIEEATSPSGEDAYDSQTYRSKTEKVVRTESDGWAVVRPGLRPFLARIFGGAAHLEGAEDIQARWEAAEGKDDEKIFIHWIAPEVLEYEPEGWELDLPDPETRKDWINLAAEVAIVIAVGALVTAPLGSSVGLAAGLVTAGVTWVRPTDGYARVKPAPAHTRSAWVSMLFLSQEFADAETIQDARTEVVRQQARAEKDVEAALQGKDETLVEEMFDTDTETLLQSKPDDRPAATNGGGSEFDWRDDDNDGE